MSVPTAEDIKSAKADLVAAEESLDQQEYPEFGRRLTDLATRSSTWEKETPPGPPPDPGPWEFNWGNFIDPPDRPSCLAPVSLPKEVDASLRVCSDSELESALRAARDAGPRVIILADGEYCFPVETNASDLFLVAERANAVLKSPAVFAGENVLTRGVTFASKTTISGQKVSILGSTFTGTDGVVVNSTARHVRIGYCRFTGNAGNKRSDHVLIRGPNSGSNIPDFIRVYRNHFRDTSKSSTGEAHHIYVFEAASFDNSRANFKSCVIALNLIDDSYRRRGIYMKNGGVDHFANHTVMHRGTALQRHGYGSRIWGNRFVGVRDLALNGPNHDLRGNSWNTSLQVMSQHLSGTGNRYQAADKFVVAMCEGPVKLGYVVNGGKVQRKVAGGVFHMHKGSISRMAEQGNTFLDSCRMTCPSPVSLSEKDVGPEAMP